MWGNLFRTVISRVVGGVIGAGAGILATKYGVDVDPATQASVTAAIVVGTYGVAHKLIDKRVNPLDTASRSAARDLGSK